MDYLFDKWRGLKKKLKDKYIFVFLDYDGTIAPIADTPAKAVLPKENKKLLKKISHCPGFKLALISGRSLEDIKKRVGLKNIIYCGNHGLEIEGPKIKFKSRLSPRYKATLRQIKLKLAGKLSSVKGVILEDKGLSLSLHYRLAEEKNVPFIKTAFHESVIVYLVRNRIKTKAGKKVLEVRPPVGWDKGKAALWLLARERFAVKHSEVFPIYIGDDITDEDAFKALKDKAITVFVGKPKDSCAKYYLKNTDEVRQFLERVLKTELLSCRN